MDWLKGIGNWFLERGRDFVEVEGPEGGYILDLLDGLSLIVMIIGFYLIMAGLKNKGAKVTSFTFLAYIIIKACVAYV